MLKIKKLIPLAVLLILIGACNNKKATKTRLQSQLDEVDTIYLNNKECSLKIKRYRIFNRKNEMFKIGKMGFQLTINDLKVDSEANYSLDSGYLIYNKKTFISTCFLNTSQIVSPVIDQNKQLKIGTPGYLNTSSKMIVFEFKGNFFPPNQEPSTSLFLTLSDTVGLIKDAKTSIKIAYAKKHKTIKLIESQFYLNGKEWDLFEKENETVIEKDSIVGLLKLVF